MIYLVFMFVFLLQMRPIFYVFFLNLLFVVWTFADPVPKPDPGHMVIKYYKDRRAEAQKKNYEKMKYKCEQQRYSGYSGDPQCIEFLKQRLTSSAPKKSTSVIALVLVPLFLKLWI